jgi:hypothetical protein
MWSIKTTVIPIIIGATGTISKSFRKYVSTIPGNHDVRELQKTAILGTAHILWKGPGAYPEGGLGGSNPPRNYSEVLTNPSRIPSSVENTS